jgi:hypothetical protein
MKCFSLELIDSFFVVLLFLSGKEARALLMQQAAREKPCIFTYFAPGTNSQTCEYLRNLNIYFGGQNQDYLPLKQKVEGKVTEPSWAEPAPVTEEMFFITT